MTATAGPGDLAGDVSASAPVADALAAVARERFIPDRVWVEEIEDGPYEPVDRRGEPERWMRNVYSDRVLITQFDDGATEWPQVGLRPSCSSSMPSAVSGMLDALAVQPGQSVLEVGAGTGWSAALLGELVGQHGSVTTVETDPALASTARACLDGDYPNIGVVLGDGTAGMEEKAPFDRIIATASVQLGRFPYAWVEQTRPDGVIVAPVRTELASGPLVRFEVTGDGSAVGRAVPTRVGFMEVRAQRTAGFSFSRLRWDDPDADRRESDTAPWAPLLAEAPLWAIAVALPSCRHAVWERTEERDHGVAWLGDPLTGSWASVVPSTPRGRYIVRQSGPRRLWDEAETAYHWWQRAGEPDIEAWEWTIAQHRQIIRLPGA